MAENIENNGCSQRDNAEHEGYSVYNRSVSWSIKKVNQKIFEVSIAAFKSSLFDLITRWSTVFLDRGL